MPLTESTTESTASGRSVLLGGGPLFSAAVLSKAADVATSSSTQLAKGGNPTTSITTTKDGTQIDYKERGARTAPHVVLSHGWPLTANAWEGRMFFLASDAYRRNVS